MLTIAWGGNPMEWGIIVLIIVLLFGIKKLPEIGKSMAEGIHEFKKAAREAQKADEEEDAGKSDSSKSDLTRN